MHARRSALAGCGTTLLEPITSNPKMQTVSVDGEPVMVAPYSDGTWGATRSKMLPMYNKNPALERPILIRAVEIATGCKVTDAHYDDRHDNLAAAVDCKH